MNSMRRRVRLALSYGFAALTLAASAPARADEPTVEEPSEDVETASDTVGVHVAGPSGVVLERLDSTWTHVCDAPCDATIARSASYRIAGKNVVPQPLVLPSYPSPAGLRAVVRPASRAKKDGLTTGGTLIAGLGVVLFVVGGVVVFTHLGRPFCGGLGLGGGPSPDHADEHYREESSCKARNQQLEDVRDTGWLAMGAGVLAGVGGAILYLSGQSERTKIAWSGAPKPRAVPVRLPTYLAARPTSATVTLPLIDVRF
jgi:hypothetical protein